jgi:hypothetical protein
VDSSVSNATALADRRVYHVGVRRGINALTTHLVFHLLFRLFAKITWPKSKYRENWKMWSFMTCKLHQLFWGRANRGTQNRKDVTRLVGDEKSVKNFTQRCCKEDRIRETDRYWRHESKIENGWEVTNVLGWTGWEGHRVTLNGILD